MIDTGTLVANPQDTISLMEDFHLDLRWWHTFTTPWSGRSFFLLPHWTPAPNLDLFTDSAASIGFGAFLAGQWFNGKWSITQAERSIQWIDYPIVLSAQT